MIGAYLTKNIVNTAVVNPARAKNLRSRKRFDVDLF